MGSLRTRTALPDLRAGRGGNDAATMLLVACGTVSNLAKKIVTAVLGADRADALAGVLQLDLDADGSATFLRWWRQTQRESPILQAVLQQLPAHFFKQGLAGDLIAAEAARPDWAPLVSRASDEFTQQLLTGSLVHNRADPAVVIHLMGAGAHALMSLHLLAELTTQHPTALHVLIFVLPAEGYARRRNVPVVVRDLESFTRKLSRTARTPVLVLVVDNTVDLERSDRSVAAFATALADSQPRAFQPSAFNAVSQFADELEGVPRLATLAAAIRPVGVFSERVGLFSRRQIVDNNQAIAAVREAVRRAGAGEALAVRVPRAIAPHAGAGRENGFAASGLVRAELVQVLVPSADVEGLYDNVRRTTPPSATLVLTGGKLDGQFSPGPGGGLIGLVVASRLVALPGGTLGALAAAASPQSDELLDGLVHMSEAG